MRFPLFFSIYIMRKSCELYGIRCASYSFVTGPTATCSSSEPGVSTKREPGCRPSRQPMSQIPVSYTLMCLYGINSTSGSVLRSNELCLAVLVPCHVTQIHPSKGEGDRVRYTPSVSRECMTLSLPTVFINMLQIHSCAYPVTSLK